MLQKSSRVQTVVVVREYRDPAVMPHHDGVIPRNSETQASELVLAEQVLQRPGWNAGLIARYLGYPDSVFYSPEEPDEMPWRLYALNRVLTAEQRLF